MSGAVESGELPQPDYATVVATLGGAVDLIDKLMGPDGWPNGSYFELLAKFYRSIFDAAMASANGGSVS